MEQSSPTSGNEQVHAPRAAMANTMMAQHHGSHPMQMTMPSNHSVVPILPSSLQEANQEDKEHGWEKIVMLVDSLHRYCHNTGPNYLNQSVFQNLYRTTISLVREISDLKAPAVHSALPQRPINRTYTPPNEYITNLGMPVLAPLQNAGYIQPRPIQAQPMTSFMQPSGEMVGMDMYRKDIGSQKKRDASDAPVTKRKKATAVNRSNLKCKICHQTETPEWRKGPDGNHTLCNACGLNYAKKVKQLRRTLEQQGRRKHSIEGILDKRKHSISMSILTERLKKFEKKKSTKETSDANKKPQTGVYHMKFDIQQAPSQAPSMHQPNFSQSSSSTCSHPSMPLDSQSGSMMTRQMHMQQQVSDGSDQLIQQFKQDPSVIQSMNMNESDSYTIPTPHDYQ